MPANILDKINALVQVAAEQVLLFGGQLPALAGEAIPLLRQLIVAVADMDGTGAEKRALVLQAMETWYDRVVPAIAIPWPWFLMWLELVRPFVRPWVKQMVLAAAGYALEAIYNDLKSQGSV
jgi:hypothetical protein